MNKRARAQLYLNLAQFNLTVALIFGIVESSPKVPMAFIAPLIASSVLMIFHVVESRK